MKSVKYVFVFALAMLFFPAITKAECSYERLSELSKIAGNVQFSYSYEVKDKRPVFYVDVTNITGDIYVKEIDKTFYRDSQIRYNNGKTVNFVIYSNDVLCRGEVLLKRSITLPAFNKYSTYKQCEKYRGFELCQKWADTSALSFDDFNKKLVEYIGSLNQEEEIDAETYSFTKFLKENLVIIATVLGFVILLILLIYFERRISYGRS